MEEASASAPHPEGAPSTPPHASTNATSTTPTTTPAKQHQSQHQQPQQYNETATPNGASASHAAVTTVQHSHGDAVPDSPSDPSTSGRGGAHEGGQLTAHARLLERVAGEVSRVAYLANRGKVRQTTS